MFSGSCLSAISRRAKHTHNALIMLPATALLVLAAAAVRAAPASDPPPKYNRPLPDLPTHGIPGGSMFMGWEEVRWQNTNKCLTAPDQPYEGAGVFLYVSLGRTGACTC